MQLNDFGLACAPVKPERVSEGWNAFCIDFFFLHAVAMFHRSLSRLNRRWGRRKIATDYIESTLGQTGANTAPQGLSVAGNPCTKGGVPSQVSNKCPLSRVIIVRSPIFRHG